MKMKKGRIGKVKRNLRKCIRSIKKSQSNTTIKSARIEILAEAILDEEKENFARKISKTVDALKKDGGGMDQGAFWKFKKKLDGKKREERTAMKDSTGRIIEDKEGILNIYEQFYKELLQTPQANYENEKEKEREIEETFMKLQLIAKYQSSRVIGEDDVRKATRRLKRKKAGDREGWTNELIIEGGDEMVKSVVILCNRVMDQMHVPKQWKEMTIKSVHKKGSKMLMDNRRGLFLTNILSKLFERVLDDETTEEIDMSEYQCGGRKGRGTIDNQIMMKAVTDYNQGLNKKTYLYFADAYKCFDRLWLKDCLIELWRAGMRERDVMLIFEMNKKANIIINTPVGESAEIEVQEIVRQGTIFGPKLCCISTQKVNNRRIPMSTTVSPELGIKAPVYVDDILGMGSKKMVERAIDNTRWLEEEKKFKFNRNKSKYMVVKTGREKDEEVVASVKDGKIERTNEYKYLGMWITEENNILKQISEHKDRLKMMMREIKNVGNKCKVGSRDAEVQRLLYESTVIPTITYNMELMTHLTEKEEEELEKLQRYALANIYELPPSTPYWGILIETGVWPIKYRLMYKRLMLYRHLMHSPEERISAQIVLQQKKYKLKGTLYDQMEKDSHHVHLSLSVVEEYNVKKSEWKKIVKQKILSKISREAIKQANTMTKLRFLKNSAFDEKQYITQSTVEEAGIILRAKLNMCKIGSNYGQHRQCIMCKMESETTEHLFECEEIRKILVYDGRKINDCVQKKECMKMTRFLDNAIQVIDEKRNLPIN